jgi:hypothetical protein
MKRLKIGARAAGRRQRRKPAVNPTFGSDPVWSGCWYGDGKLR